MSLNKTTFLFTLMSLVFAHTFAQTATPKVVYVIDSITVINDPEKGDDVLSGDISDMSIIKNKDSLKLLGYEQFDVASFIFTRAYRSRPDSIKIIPSTKSMQRKDGIWIYHGVPYTGRIVNYYYSGRKQSEGFLLNGKVNGVDTLYYQNGHISVEREYKEGRPNGVEREYYRDGLLLQEGRFMDGKEEGVWKTYYPNGQVKLSSNYKAGELFDSAVRYYSSGIVRERVFIQNGKVTPDPRLSRISQFMTKSEERNKEGDAKAAIEYASKAIKTDSTYADAWFSRGTIKLNEYQFDEAIVDLEKALAIEPFMEVALANRAFARIRKYQFGSSRRLSKHDGIEIRASRDEVPVPPADKEKICSDLQKAIMLGDKSDMITEALTNYCQLNSSRL